MTANLIVWGIVQSADLQSVINQMTQRDQQQASEKISLPSALFGGTHKYVNCETGTASNCKNPTPTGCSSGTFCSFSGQANTPLVTNENFTTNTNGWIFTKILAPGTTSGITGGYDSGGTEIGAVGSPSGPGLIYMGVSYFPPTGTATYSSTWSNKFFVDLSQLGIATGNTLSTDPKCSGPNCSVVGSWAWILPRVNPGVIALTVKFEVADSSSTGTSCNPPHCYVMDSQTYTTLADQTWNYRKVTWGALSVSGTVSTSTAGTQLEDTSQTWTTNQWANYTVTMTSGSQKGESALICSNTSNTLTITAPTSATPHPCASPTAWTPPSVGGGYVIALTTSGTATGTQTSTTLVDTSQKWYANEWQNDYVTIVSGTGATETAVVQSNTANTLTLVAPWSTTPVSASSGYVIGCPTNNFCGWDIHSSTLLSQISTSYTPAFWGKAGSPGFYTVQVETDFTLSQSSNPAEVRVLFDDVGLEFKTPAFFASSTGSTVQTASGAAGTVLDMPITGGEDTALIQQLTVSTATAFNEANIHVSTYIKDYTIGGFVPLTEGFVSQQTVNNTNIFTGADVQKYIGFLTDKYLLTQPVSSAFDSSGNLWVSDKLNNRVLEFSASSLTSDGSAASVVVGQSSFNGSASATTATGLNSPTGIAFDSSGNLWVADTGNNRVLEFSAASLSSSNPTAALVLGQSGFSTSAVGTSASALSGPNHLAFDSASPQNLWVTDSGNNRILKFVPGTSPCSSGQFCNNMGASTVIGQSAFTTSSPATTASGLSGPGGIKLDGSGNLWVADTGNNRVLEFLKSGFANGESASLVLGQSLFTTSGTATTAKGLSGPVSLAFDSAAASANLWVADTGNNRILEFTYSFSSDEAATTVIGQKTLTSNTGATSSTGLNSPTAVVFSSGNAWVTDKSNNRVLEFPSGSLGSSPPTATIELGQTAGTNQFTTAEHPNVEVEFIATSTSSFVVKTMAASVQDFFKDQNHVTIQVTNGWASTSHVVDVFVIDSTGTRCFTRVPSACAASLLPSASSTSTTSAGTVSGTTLTDVTGKQGTWAQNQWSNYQTSPDYNFAFILNGTSAGAYGTVASNNATGSGGRSYLTVSSWIGGSPSGKLQYFIGQTWGGLYVAPGTTGVITFPYTWTAGPVTIKVTTDLGNTVVLNTVAS